MRWDTAAETAAQIRTGQVQATQVVQAALDRIAQDNPALNAFTDVVADRALSRARAIDGGAKTGPLAGVPFAVKNLFDIAGLPTRAGSAINRTHPPAAADAPLITRMEATGAVLVGGLNMGEYAYDFTGENIHDGPSRNPHDLTHMTGGSSGGSCGAVAAGLVPIALGSDTNGSIRVPSSLCGLFGLKPTFGRLDREGTFPFVSSLDHLGPLARSVTDLVLAYDAMQTGEPLAGTLDGGVAGLRVAVAGGHFQHGAFPEALAALHAVAAALGATREVELPGAARARAAAYIITATEGAALHLDRLRTRPDEFDPAVRDRLIAGALLPAPPAVQAQKFRRLYRATVLALFETVDVILAPATPCSAPLLRQQTFELAGQTVPVRAHLGIYTQPISFIGLPVVAVPVPQAGMPIGVQVIAAPWREDVALRVARALERDGVCLAQRPKGFA